MKLKNILEEDWKNIKQLSDEKYRTWNGTMAAIQNIILSVKRNLKKVLFK